MACESNCVVAVSFAKRAGLWMSLLLFLGLMAPGPCEMFAHAESASIETLIRSAGNATGDEERLRVLKELQDHPQLDGQLKRDVDRLVVETDRWIHGSRLEYFSQVLLKNHDYDFGIAENSAAYPLTYLYRGRMILRLMFGYGGYWGTAEKREPLYNKARAFFQRYRDAFPENRIARMYLGETFTAPQQYEAVAGAPEWAVHQREGLERLADIIKWWIDHRMRADGQYGGGWADDCEMWRWWVAILIGFDDPKISAAQAQFSEALLSQPHLRDGYTTHLYDVEHTAEDSADALTPMMHLRPDSDEWQKRALRLAELMETFWTGRNERGFLQYKSTYFSVNKVDPSPQRACDTVYHPRAVQPALLYWQRTGDEKLGRLFTAWMDTWVDATARSEHGKPPGVIPSAIHWPDGRVGGPDDRWWAPKNHGESKLYYWPSAMGMMTNTLLLTWHMTGDEKYLAPIRSMARIRLDYLRDRPKVLPPGSAAWCGWRYRRISEVAPKHKLLTGRSDFDELLTVDSSPYLDFRFQGSLDALTQALRENAAALSLNFEGYTSEVRYTDRVLMTPKLFRDPLNFAKPDRTVHEPNPMLLYSTVTGDPGSPGYFPFNAVRWLTPPRDIAALVTLARSDRFEAELFHFGESPRSMAAELYLLEPGNYSLTLSWPDTDDATPLNSSQVLVNGPRIRVELKLPPRQLRLLRIERED